MRYFGIFVSDLMFLELLDKPWCWIQYMLVVMESSVTDICNQVLSELIALPADLPVLSF